MKQFIKEAINSEKDRRKHDHRPPLTPLEDARMRIKLMDTYFFGTVTTLAVRPTQVASSSQPSAVDNSGGTSEDDETSDQEDEEEEAIDVSFLHKECGSQSLTTQWLELHTEAVQKKKLLKQQKAENSKTSCELPSAEERAQQLKPCTAKWKSGARAGQVCGRLAMPEDGLVLCNQHKRKPIQQASSLQLC